MKSILDWLNKVGTKKEKKSIFGHNLIVLNDYNKLNNNLAKFEYIRLYYYKNKIKVYSSNIDINDNYLINEINKKSLDNKKFLEWLMQIINPH